MTSNTRPVHIHNPTRRPTRSKLQRIWSRKVLKVVEYYVAHPTSRLFAITGDLDNLGIFVSRNGRPLAENLVDVYNRLIGAFMYSVTRRHRGTIPRFCMIPSGEEIFAIGVATNVSVVKRFFSILGSEVNEFICVNAPMLIDGVTVSFGCSLFPSKIVRPLATQFVTWVRRDQAQKASQAYLELMLLMRQTLAYELDRAKFRSLDVHDLDLVVFFRNTVYAKLREYKQSTRLALLLLAEKVRGDPELQDRLRLLVLNSQYGISDEDVRTIVNLISQSD